MNKIISSLVAVCATLAVASPAGATNDQSYTPPVYPPHDPAPCVEYRMEKATSTWSKKTGWSAFTDWPDAGPLAWGQVPNPRTGSHGGTQGKDGYRVYAYVAVDKRAVVTGECAPTTTTAPPTTLPPTTLPPTTLPPETTAPPTTAVVTTTTPAPTTTAAPTTTTPPPSSSTPPSTEPTVVVTTAPPTIPATTQPPTVPTVTTPTLPATGQDMTLPSVLATIAVLTGVSLLAVRRRSSRTS